LSIHNFRCLRVIEVNLSNDKLCSVVVMAEDQEFEIPWKGCPPLPGDVFLETSNNTLQRIGRASPGVWNLQGDAMRWRQKNNKPSRMSVLWQRHKIRKSVRNYFDNEGFIEIDAPLLVRGTTPDAFISSFSVEDRFLVTSTEYQIKRLEVAGFNRVYTLTQNFRHNDIGSRNSPEFTMLEWARVGMDLKSIEEDAEQIVWRAHKELGGGGTINYNGYEVNLQPPWVRLPVLEAITKFVGVAIPDFSLVSIKKAIEAAGIAVHSEWGEDRRFLFSLLLDHLQQYLGLERPVFLKDWPSFLTSSAKEKSDKTLVDRSELFVAGVELSDGFPSLTDYERQRETFQQQIICREQEKALPATIDFAYLEALKAGLPEGAGMALGFDRLVMLLTGQTEIRSVQAFAWDEV